MTISLSERTIIITGASSGIGAATARACAAAGMDVVLTARRQDRLDAVAADVRDLGRTATVIVGDITDRALHADLLAAGGQFHAVYANAGYGATQCGLDGTDETDRRMFDVNYFSAVELLRAAATQLVAENRPGHLLMCSSCLSKFSLPRHGTYAATKAAQNLWCSAFRLELAPQRIAVSSVHPITTTTEFFDVSAREGGRPPRNGPPAHAPGFFVQPPERVARAIVRCLQKPVPEVWTSHIVRTVAGFMTIFPRFGDFVIRRQAGNDER